MLKSEQDVVRRIVREELDTLLEEIRNQATFLDVGPAGDTTAYAVELLMRQVQALRGLPDKSDDARTEVSSDE